VLAIEFALGTVIGAAGTLIGAGGGFLLVPILILGFGLPARVAVGTSLTTVFFNALAGSIAYSRQRRVDYHSGLWFAAATLPGAVLGAHVVGWLSSDLFHLLFGLLLVGLAAWLARGGARPPAPGRWPATAPAHGDRAGGWWTVTRRFTDAFGQEHEFQYSRATGLGLSTGVGFLSSLLGIGGGILHVPIMVYRLGFPAHVATATSHFILALSAGVGAAVHWSLGNVHPQLAVAIALGTMAGAPVGAWLAPRVPQRVILGALGAALFFVGARLIWLD